jgi:hypothetical protein
MRARTRAHARFSSDSPITTKTDGLDGGASRIRTGGVTRDIRGSSGGRRARPASERAADRACLCVAQGGGELSNWNACGLEQLAGGLEADFIEQFVALSPPPSVAGSTCGDASVRAWRPDRPTRLGRGQDAQATSRKTRPSHPSHADSRFLWHQVQKFDCCLRAVRTFLT